MTKKDRPFYHSRVSEILKHMKYYTCVGTIVNAFVAPGTQIK